MSITRNTHRRILNSLEERAVQLVIERQFYNEHKSLEIVLGEEGGKPFVQIGRVADDNVRIHFEQGVE